MATIGLDKLFYADITEDDQGNETYGKPKQLAKAISADLSVELNEATLYADDGQAEAVKEFKGGTISLGVDDIGHAVAADLVGAKLDKNGVLISGSEDTSKYVAIGFRAKKANGKYKYYWLYRVLFGVPATNLATKGDSISFQTPTIEGTIFRRNKLDGNKNHPWKAEVTESADNSAVISKWYDKVYEPVYETEGTSGSAGETEAETTVNHNSISLDEPFLCTFDGTEADIATDDRVKVTGNQASCTETTVTELGKTFTKLLKMETATQVTFSTATDTTLHLFVDTTAKRIKIDGVMYTSETTENGDNVVTFNIEAGTHTITKGDALGLFAIQLTAA
ncbi:MAG: hypothetical protein K2O89_02290 [Clostridia bacterium]|nr:hypothetical protein [Clostridia bacterium]